jgi:glutamine amidotransferase
MKLVIIDYGAGNTKSVKFALGRLGLAPVLSNDKEVIAGADKIIFPGVGHAKAAMEVLAANGLHTFIPTLKQPVLGICLGMQLLCAHSEEGDIPCLGIIDETVKLFEPKLKVPHTGWNQCEHVVDGNSQKARFLTSETSVRNDKSTAHYYFVHSYYVPVNQYTTLSCNYINDFSAAVQKDNFYGAQFHPEKSGLAGEQYLKWFLAL